MAAIDEIQIEQVILHILDPHGKRGLVLSQRPLPPETDEQILGYFKTHIEKSLTDPQARAAHFTDLSHPSASACRNILAGATDLVSGSQDLARTLFNIMKANRRISRGDLVACLYRAKEGGKESRYLALLKIDPVEAFRHVRKMDEKGREYVTFEIETEVMPTTREELQKCAFVRELEPRPPEADMILLDRQRPAEGLDVARFFSEEFLGAELVVDSRQATIRLYRWSVSLENELRPLGQWDAVEPEVQRVLSSPTVNLTRKWIAGLGLPPGAVAKVQSDLQAEQLFNRRIVLDGGYLAKAQKVKYSGDFGLKLEVLANHFDTVVQSVQRVQPNAGPDYYEIVIHTHTWKRVP